MFLVEHYQDLALKLVGLIASQCQFQCVRIILYQGGRRSHMLMKITSTHKKMIFKNVGIITESQITFAKSSKPTYILCQ